MFLLLTRLAAFSAGCVIVSQSLAQSDVLRQLGERYETRQAVYREALGKANNTDSADANLEKLDARNMFVDNFLDVEQQYRGQPAAISALYQLMKNASGVGDPDAPASAGRVRAIRILKQHYLDHPDLDLLLSSFESGAFVPEAESLLRAASQSRDERVRTTARYRLASFLRFEIQVADTLKEQKASASDHADPPRLIELHKKLLKQFETISPIDTNERRKEAIGLVEQILREGSQIRESYVTTHGPAGLNVERSEIR